MAKSPQQLSKQDLMTLMYMTGDIWRDFQEEARNASEKQYREYYEGEAQVYLELMKKLDSLVLEANA